MATHVIIGAGPVGSTTALRLASDGHDIVLGTRRGGGPSHPRITLRTINAASAGELIAVAGGAATIINCVNPPYTSWPTDWPPMAEALQAAAEQTGAALITMGNLYGYGSALQRMKADTPLDATTVKGRVRADMWQRALAAHRAGTLRTAEVRASDFYGPLVLDATMGERVVPRVLRGKGVQLLGSADVPHSFSYMPDVAKVLAAVATDPQSWGRAWLVPSVESTQRGMVNAFARAADRPGTKVTVIPKVATKALSRFVPIIRELEEIRYQFDAPFVVDASDTTDHFDIKATDLDEAARQTVDWWKDRVTTPR